MSGNILSGTILRPMEGHKTGSGNAFQMVTAELQKLGFAQQDGTRIREDNAVETKRYTMAASDMAPELHLTVGHFQSTGHAYVAINTEPYDDRMHFYAQMSAPRDVLTIDEVPAVVKGYLDRLA